MFTMRGRLRMGGSAVYEVTWDGGALSGDDGLVAAIQAHARSEQGEGLGWFDGPFTVRDHLADPSTALYLLSLYFDGDAVASGKVPERPPARPGAWG